MFKFLLFQIRMRGSFEIKAIQIFITCRKGYEVKPIHGCIPLFIVDVPPTKATIDCFAPYFISSI